MATQPSVKVNGYEIGAGLTRRIVWAETEGLLEATKPSAWTSFETFQGPGRNHAGDMDYPVRRLSIVVRITKQDSFLSKHEALATLAGIFTGKPAIVQVGSLYVEAEFSPPQVQKDAWKLTAGYLTVRFEGEAIPGTFFGEYGYQQGRDQGIIVQDDRPDHPSLIFIGNSITVTNPGTAPAEAVVQLTNTSLPSTTVYLKGAEGQMMPVNLDATGYGRIDEAYGFLLYPGANQVQLVDSLGALITTGTFKTCLYGTRFRHIGNTSNRMADGPVFQFARTGSKTYIGSDGTLKTAGDGVAAFGLPWVVRRNLLANSADFSASNWSKSVAYELKGKDKIRLITTATYQLAARQEWVSVLPNTTYTAKVKVKGSGSMWFVMYGVDNAYANGNTDGANTLTLNGDEQEHTLTFTTRATTTRISFRIQSNNAIMDAEVWEPQLELGSTATPYQPTNATGVDLTNLLNGAGLMLEGGTVNRISNPTFGTDTAGWSLGGGSARTTADSYVDGASIRLSKDITGFRDMLTQSHTVLTGIAANKVYALSTHCKTLNANNWAVSVRVEAFDSSGVFIARAGQTGWVTGDESGAGGRINLPTGAQINGQGWVRHTFTLPATPAGTARITLKYWSDAGWVGDYGYIDAIQLEANPFATSFVNGTRQPDLCGIVPPHNLIQWSEGLDVSSYWVPDANISATAATAGGRSCFKVDKSAAIGSRALRVNVTVTKSGPFTFSLPLLAGTRSKATLRIYNSTKAANAAASKAVDLSAAEWRNYSITTTTHPSAGDTLQIIVYPDDSDTAANSGYVYANMGLLNEGSMPGPYVRTTDTPIPAPVSPALDPAWQQNGRVSFRALWPTITVTDAVNRVVFGDQGATLRLAQYNGTLLYTHRKDSSGTARLLSYSNAALVKDGAPHDVELEWTNEINEQTGVREMWQRLYIDGTLVAEQDVAALYGATAWADIDPSRLISDGNVFAVLCGPKKGVIVEFPTKRAGYRPAA